VCVFLSYVSLVSLNLNTQKNITINLLKEAYDKYEGEEEGELERNFKNITKLGNNEFRKVINALLNDAEIKVNVKNGRTYYALN
jgi:hypothetical protein